MRREFTAAMAMLLTITPAFGKVLAVIDKRTQTVTVSKDGEQLWVWKVSTGRQGYATPSGTFHPTFLDADHASSKYESAPMPWSVFFNGDVAIHGTTEVRRLGRAVSHGCVRLHPDQAEEFYQLVQEEGLPNVTIRVTSSKGSIDTAENPAYERPSPRYRPYPRYGYRPYPGYRYRPYPRYPRNPWGAYPPPPYPAYGGGWGF
jgi:L,D-transpeptidase catalytic domain